MLCRALKWVINCGFVSVLLPCFTCTQDDCTDQRQAEPAEAELNSDGLQLTSDGLQPTLPVLLRPSFQLGCRVAALWHEAFISVRISQVCVCVDWPARSRKTRKRN